VAIKGVADSWKFHLVCKAPVGNKMSGWTFGGEGG